MIAPSIVAVPEEILPNIVPLLHQHGINCELMPVQTSDGTEKIMRCSRSGAIVTVTIQRESQLNPDGLIVVCGRGREDLQSKALSDAIVGVLMDNGGWYPAS